MEPPPAAYLPDNDRYTRLGESSGGVVGRGGFGKVFQGFDKLTNQHLTIKRQKIDDPAAGIEVAVFRTLKAFPNDNILAMSAQFIGKHKGEEFLYIAVESCATSLLQLLALDCPREQEKLLLPNMAQHYLLGVAMGLRHLHGIGMAHGDLSPANVLLTYKIDVKLCDFGTAYPAHAYVTRDKLCAAYIRPPEAVAGSQEKSVAGDSWALGILGLAVFGREIPSLPDKNAENDEAWQRHAFFAAAKLLEPID